jgi:hypothetical protein
MRGKMMGEGRMMGQNHVGNDGHRDIASHDFAHPHFANHVALAVFG